MCSDWLGDISFSLKNISSNVVSFKISLSYVVVSSEQLDFVF